MRYWFRKKWVITLIGVIALSILVWFAGPLIAIADKIILGSVTSRVIIICILFLIWIVSNLHISIKSRRDVKQFSRDLEKNTAESIESESRKTGSDSSELAMLKKHFNETLTTLKDTQWGGKTGIRNLYEQPWFVIIGAPGSGKTTALINSGLNFPLSKTTGHVSVSGIGGTRFCEWLITDEAVLIDTAGRYTTQDSDAQADASGWRDFLSLLKKHKKQRPVNGVLITLSMQDILQQNNDEKKFQINSIQKRLQELNNQLGVQVPVYFILTKCDLINGFKEFFGDLSQEERQQVWGITFPEETIFEKELNIKTAFLPEYDNLIARVNKRLISRLYEEKQVKLKGQILGFPQQMAVVREQLNDFIVALFSPTRFYQRVMLRGVYFTSGTQKGVPIDQVKDYFSNTFGLEPHSPGKTPEKEYSFFLYGLLKNVVFRESGLAGGNVDLENKLKWLKVASLASIAAISLLAIFLWTTSYFANDERVNAAESFMDSFFEEVKPLKASQDQFEEKETLPALKDIYQASRVYGADKDDIPMNIQYGLYQGDNLSPLEDSYFQQLNQLLIPSVSRRLVRQMHEHQNNSEYLYQALKAYLMLGLPNRLDKEFVHQWMEYDWQERYQDKNTVRELNVHLDNALSRLEKIELNEQLVQKVRDILLEVPLPKQIYMRLKQDAEGLGNDYTFENNVGNHLNNVFNNTNKTIPWLYTKDGYQKYFQKNSMTFIKDYLKDDWVLGTSLTEFNLSDLKSFYSEVEALYMEDYIAYWKNALMSLKVKNFTNINELISLLDMISGQQLPFKSVLNDTKENTLLSGFQLPELPGSEDAEELIDALPGGSSSAANKLKTAIRKSNKLKKIASKGNNNADDKPDNLVKQHFTPIHQVFKSDETALALIGQIQVELTELLNLLNKINASEDVNEAIFLQVKKYLQGDGFNSKLRLLAKRSPEPLRSWLTDISVGVWAVAVKNTRNYINDVYIENVYSFYQERLVNRYPLFKDKKEDIMLSDFITFFKPEGIEHNFFKDYIKPFVYIKGDFWREREINGVYLDLGSEYLEQLKKAEQIREVIFKGGQKPEVNFSIKLNSVSKRVKQFGFQLDKQSGLFSTKTLFKVKKYRWPSEEAFGRVAVIVLLKNKDQIGIAKTGPWSVFRLLDVVRVEPVDGTNYLNIDADFKQHRADFQLIPDSNSSINPFSSNLLQTYRCLENI